MSRDLIKPQTLRGFRDLLPGPARLRERVVDAAKGVFRRYGFGPIDTPALEYAEILLGKGESATGGAETAKQTFRFTDNGGRDVALRFDLTVPFARFAAQHAGTLGTPFKRYHVAPVWRGERPQKGRYREFVQCDFDTIGTDGAVADAETVCVIHDLLAAISAGVTPSCGAFTIRLNHRGVLNGLLDTLGLREHATDVLRSLDKLAKAGEDAVRAELLALPGATAETVGKVFEFAALSGPAAGVVERARPLLAGSDGGLAALDRLGRVLEFAVAGGCDPDRLTCDLSIARGLDYYTGVVFETFLEDDPASAACAAAGGTTTSRASTPSSGCRAWGRASASTGCWRTWRRKPTRRKPHAAAPAPACSSRCSRTGGPATPSPSPPSCGPAGRRSPSPPTSAASANT